MTFNPEIPQPGDLISISQGQLLINNQQLNLVYGDAAPAGDPNSDHYAFDDGTANARKHRKLRLPVLATSPTPDANDGVYYTKTVGAQSIPYYRKDAGTLDFPALPVRAMGQFNIAGPTSAATRTKYEGPLEVGEDLMQIDIGEDLHISRFAPPAGGRPPD